MDELSPAASKRDEEQLNPGVLFIPPLIFILLVSGIRYYISVVADDDGMVICIHDPTHNSAQYEVEYLKVN